jgi:pyruvate/2-oxoglutarate dehydrogenase complex dihydrolipoamide dehydrogenase (E3) component
MFDLKEYDFIVIGTGSGMEIASTMLQENPKLKAAVIDKDEPGGICLTRGLYLRKYSSIQRNLYGRFKEPGSLGYRLN